MWHEGLIFKLRQNGVTGNLLKLFKNYLSDREQNFVLNGMYSDWGSIKSGVPQGSVLGTFLFPESFSTVYDPKLSAEELNHDLQLISLWAFQWAFNPDPTKPTEEIIISRKLYQQEHPSHFSIILWLSR